MARRAVLSGAALAVCLSSSTLLSSVSADSGESCSEATPAVATAAGAVWADNPEDWWSFHGLPGTYVVTLTSSVADADLTVSDLSCGAALCTRSVAAGPEVCTVTVETGGVAVRAWSMSHNVPASYVVDVTLLRPGLLPDCVDGEDNNDDGVKDWPADSGCESPADPSEDDSPCYDDLDVAVCVETSTSGSGAPEGPFVTVANRAYEIAGHVDTYAFEVEGRKVHLPCVVLVAKPHGTFNPCKLHGSFVSRDMTLYKPITQTVPVATPRLDALNVCHARVTLTVGSARPRSFPAYTFC